MSKEKRLFITMWEAFKQSLRHTPKTSQFGEFKGEDFMGNKYYELGARPEVGRRKPSRWFESQNKDMMQEVPPEWESWLRNRRENVPTEEEIIRNKAIFELKKRNAKNNQEKESFNWGTPQKPYRSGRSSFPQYDDLESYPGEHSKDKS